jgi:hypothetical protein
LCLLAAATAVAAGPALAKKPNSSPAVVVISVADDGDCHVSPKKLWIVAKDAPAGVKGPKKVRFFYARGDSDKSKVKATAEAGQTHPGMLDLPQIGETQSMGDSSESKETFNGQDYVFKYTVAVETEDETIACDPEICIKKADGTCSGY